MLSTQKRFWLVVVPAVLIALSCGVARDALAAGWSSGLQDARSVGMGNAYHAVADTPVALHYNTAGLPLIDRKLAFQIGVHYPALLKYSAAYNYTDPVTDVTERVTHETADVPIIPHILITSNVLDQFMPKDVHLSLGIGWYVPMGGGTVDFQNMKLDLNKSSNLSGFKSELAIHNLSLGVAASWKKWVSVGANFNIHISDVGLAQSNYPKESIAQPSTFSYIDNEFEGMGVDFSGSFGLMLQDPSEMVRVGVSYKMQYNVKAKGTTTFDLNSPASTKTILKNAYGVAFPVTGDTSVEFIIPHEIMVGIAFSPLDWFTFGVSIDYTLWSNTEQMTLNWKDLGLPEQVFADGLLNKEINLKTGYDDVLSFMVGAEVEVLKDNLPIRVGYILNPAAKTPYANSVASIDTDSHIICYGAGYNVKLPRDMDLVIDAGFYHLIGVSTGGSDEEMKKMQEHLDSPANKDEKGLSIYSGPGGDYNKTILFGFLVDLTLLL